MLERTDRGAASRDDMFKEKYIEEGHFDGVYKGSRVCEGEEEVCEWSERVLA
jgi:hypothetical protein